jgi:hypothetical protein
VTKHAVPVLMCYGDLSANIHSAYLRFKEVTGNYPTRITVVGFDFKAHRFNELHRHAIGFPAEQFTYVGMIPTAPSFDHTKAASGEQAALHAFIGDLYGCNTPALADKRMARNPFRRSTPYELACPELKSLLSWCGPDAYRGALPWTLLKYTGGSSTTLTTDGVANKQTRFRAPSYA